MAIKGNIKLTWDDGTHVFKLTCSDCGAKLTIKYDDFKLNEIAKHLGH
jgi:hypothetical protein